jgi:hypothetical protein
MLRVFGAAMAQAEHERNQQRRPIGCRNAAKPRIEQPTPYQRLEARAPDMGGALGVELRDQAQHARDDAIFG